MRPHPRGTFLGTSVLVGASVLAGLVPAVFARPGPAPTLAPTPGEDAGGTVAAPSMPNVAATALSAQASRSRDTVDEEHPPRLTGSLATAEKLRVHGRHRTALRLVADYLKAHPRSVDALWLRARIEAELSMPRSALHHGLRALSLSPGDVAALIRFAQLAQDVGAIAVSDRAWNAALRLAPHDHALARAHALALASRGERATAVRLQHRLLRRSPGDPEDELALAGTLWRDGDTLGSRRAYARALHLARDRTDIVVRAAEGLADTGTYARALRILDQDARRNPKEVAPVVAKGRVLAAWGYFKQARRVLLEARRRWPRDAKVDLALSDLSRARGHERAARREIFSALALAPDDPEVLASARALSRIDGHQVPLIHVIGLNYRGYSRYTSVPVAPAVAAADAVFQGATAGATAGLLVPPVTEAVGVTEVSLAPGLLPRTRLHLESQRREHSLVLTSATPQDIVWGETGLALLGTSPARHGPEMATSLGFVRRSVAGFRPGDPEREDIDLLDLALTFKPYSDNFAVQGHFRQGEGHHVNLVLDTDVSRVDLALVQRDPSHGLTVKYGYSDDDAQARGLPSKIEDERLFVDAAWALVPAHLFTASVEQRIVSHDDPAGVLGPRSTGRSLGLLGGYERPLGRLTRISMGAGYTWDQTLGLMNLATWTMDLQRQLRFLPGQPLITLGLGRALYPHLNHTYSTLDVGLGARF